MKWKSAKVLIGEVASSEDFYNIPLYQRLYVWTNEQVDTLLEDLWNAWHDKRPSYFLGGALVRRQKEHYDLVDGQQRFTTLWLLSLVFRHDLESFEKVGEELRLRFSIRPSVITYFNHLLVTHEEPEASRARAAESSLMRIEYALRRIRKFAHDRDRFADDGEVKSFAKYVSAQVFIIITCIPDGVALNKLFEATNNRGMQLQRYEVLKARLLARIENKQERHRLGRIWEACADMSQYLERALPDALGLRSHEVARHYAHEYGHRVDYDALLRAMGKASRTQESKKLNDLHTIQSGEWTAGNAYSEEDFGPKEQEHESDPMSSILTFPQLLLHTLRIYNLKRGQNDIRRLDEKQLLESFGNDASIETKRDVRDFVRLLFEVRHVFDLLVIKWVTSDKREKHHELRELKRYNRKKGSSYWYLQRLEAKEGDGLTLLQSMLYHSQEMTTQYWLTPFLLRAHAWPDRDTLYQDLRRYDNTLFCSGDERLLSERTWELMKSIANGTYRQQNMNVSGSLSACLGLKFPHYWFYKLEFILWYQFHDEEFANDPRHSRFRMTAKNSVEHVSPQKPQFSVNIVSTGLQDAFGNLGLVSRGVNSTFGRKTFKEKQGQFEAQTKEQWDSLKLMLIYGHQEWGDKYCQDHEMDMINRFNRYLSDHVP